ncbi:MAG: glycosyltransferase family 4 protein, partial [Ilumatobacteraceae bacterium]
EIWNGVPWLSPLWCRRPRVLVLHHIHGPMWDQMFPRPLAAIGRRLEASWAPPLYRRTPTITTSEDTRRELLELGWRPELVHTGPVGVDEYFAPSDSVGKTPEPTVLAVGRQAPVKRFDLLLEQMLLVRRSVPSATLTLVGDGPLSETLRSWVAAHDASDWVTFAGRVSREELRDLYRRSWIVASASLAEGWGLALTEAAGCGTPAVATDIFGHRCSVLDGRTGLLAPVDDLSSSIVRLLTDHELRRSMAESGVRRARELSWDVLAADVLRPVYRQVCQGSNVR